MTVETGAEAPDKRLGGEDEQPERSFFEPEIETASREHIAALQERAILESLPYLYEKSAFYREHWDAANVDLTTITCLDDFYTQIPTFTKDDVKAYRDRTGDPFGGLLCVEASELTSITSTAGTTGEPELLPELWEATPPLPTVSARDLWELGLRPGDRVMVPTGTFRNYWDKFYGSLGLIPVFVDTWIGQGKKIIEAISKFDIRYVQFGLPNILEFEKYEDQYDMRAMLAPLKGASFAGQPLGSVLKHKVVETWGVNLFTYTSAGDTGTAWEGREHDGFFLWEDTMIPENVGPDGAPVGDGEIGELIATDIDNMAAPYIRFKTGDLVRLTRRPAPSGRTHARFWVVGRKGDETIVAGKAILLADVWSCVEQEPELSDGLFQIVRYSQNMDSLRLRVGYDEAKTVDLEDLRTRLRARLRDRLGIDSALEFVSAEDLLARSSSVAKFPRVVGA